MRILQEISLVWGVSGKAFPRLNETRACMLQHFWHFESDNSLLWGAVLLIVGGLVASLDLHPLDTSGFPFQLWQPKGVLNIVKYPWGQNYPQMRTTDLHKDLEDEQESQSHHREKSSIPVHVSPQSFLWQTFKPSCFIQRALKLLLGSLCWRQNRWQIPSGSHPEKTMSSTTFFLPSISQCLETQITLFHFFTDGRRPWWSYVYSPMFPDFMNSLCTSFFLLSTPEISIKGLLHARHGPRCYSLNMSKRRLLVSQNSLSCFTQVQHGGSCRGKVECSINYVLLAACPFQWTQIERQRQSLFSSQFRTHEVMQRISAEDLIDNSDIKWLLRMILYSLR